MDILTCATTWMNILLLSVVRQMWETTLCSHVTLSLVTTELV